MGVLTILQPSETFEHAIEGADEAVLTLRVPGEAQVDALRKRHRTTKFVHGARTEDFDAFAFAADVLDVSIVNWRGVCAQGGEPLPCTRETKGLLPERVKAEVVRLCLGKEAGLEAAPGER